jgi:hypothetical protein
MVRLQYLQASKCIKVHQGELKANKSEDLNTIKAEGSVLKIYIP